MTRRDATRALSAVGRRFYARGWVFGTSGNFSVALDRDPMRLLITASGAHKGTLTPAQFLTIDGHAAPVGRTRLRPSAEALLHTTIVRLRGAGAVLHTHSMSAATVPDRCRDAGGLAIEGFEMLKALDGVTTHEHCEWIPVLDNDQDMDRLASRLEGTLVAHPDAHAVLLHRHGLYTWGRTLIDAERHIEALEFLLEGVTHGTGSFPR